jgi:hypothetical protein
MYRISTVDDAQCARLLLTELRFVTKNLSFLNKNKFFFSFQVSRGAVRL